MQSPPPEHSTTSSWADADESDAAGDLGELELAFEKCSVESTLSNQGNRTPDSKRAAKTEHARQELSSPTSVIESQDIRVGTQASLPPAENESKQHAQDDGKCATFRAPVGRS